MKSSQIVLILVAIGGFIFVFAMPFRECCRIGAESQTDESEQFETVNSDIVSGIAQKAADQITKEFEIRDVVEARLVFVEVLLSKDEFHGSLISIVIFRNDTAGGRSKAYEKRFSDNWAIRMKRVVTSTVSQPIAVVTKTKVKKGVVVTRENVLQYDKKNGWQKLKGNDKLQIQ